MTDYGWSSTRGSARHIVLADPAYGEMGYCGSPIRLFQADLPALPTTTAKRLRHLEVCDWCQAARRRAKAHR